MAVCRGGGGDACSRFTLAVCPFEGMKAFLIFSMCSPSVYTVVVEFLTLHSIYLLRSGRYFRTSLSPWCSPCTRHI